MGTRAYKPAISVKLIKLVRRTQGNAEFYSPPTDFELTPFLGDLGSIRTVKSIREPAGGFTISFGDRKAPARQDTVYALVEPMDMVEIRASRTPEAYAGKDLPLIMRGFVTSISRSEDISSEGAPHRVVVISGHDSGYFWFIQQVFFELMYITDVPYLTQFQAQAATGIENGLLKVSDFVSQAAGFVNKKIAGLSAYSNHVIKEFIPKCTVPEGMVAPNLAANLSGPLWKFVKFFQDDPWNELFIVDTEEGPVLVFRPVPYHGLDGKLLSDGSGNLIMLGAVEPGTVAATDADVVAMEISRDDKRIANFFWTEPGASLLDTNGYTSRAALLSGSPLEVDYPNNDPKLYGVRKMPTTTALFSDELRTLPGLAPTGQEGAQSSYQNAWHLYRMVQLKAANMDNSVYETGSLSMRGSENAQHGKYLQLTRGNLVCEYYMVGVSHTFSPFQTWTTQVSVERGTGFLVRNKMQQSPWLAEKVMPPIPADATTIPW